VPESASVSPAPLSSKTSNPSVQLPPVASEPRVVQAVLPPTPEPYAVGGTSDISPDHTAPINGLIPERIAPELFVKV
jgi:hypothetical protein